MLNVNLLQI